MKLNLASHDSSEAEQRRQVDERCDRGGDFGRVGRGRGEQTQQRLGETEARSNTLKPRHEHPVLGFPTHIATATSHFVLAFMALVATITHVLTGTFHHTVGLRRAAALSIGVIAGALCARLSKRLSGQLIQQLLAAGLLLLGIRLILSVAL